MPVFERLNANRVRAKLVVVGTGVNLRAPWMEHREWSLDTEQAELANFDIGVMPLPDDEWTRGKCGYKLLQYFAAAVPAVASPVGVNRSIIGSARGYLADTAGDWFRALSELINDVDLRRQMGANGRAFVEREFSYQRWAPEYAALLRQL
jgi:glycosyltransferase involved in cell wall biosynthesis